MLGFLYFVPRESLPNSFCAPNALDLVTHNPERHNHSKTQHNQKTLRAFKHLSPKPACYLCFSSVRPQVHCFAGAHRAGTTGVAFLMQAEGLRADDAITTAARERAAIDPRAFPELYDLLLLLEEPEVEQGEVESNTSY